MKKSFLKTFCLSLFFVLNVCLWTASATVRYVSLDGTHDTAGGYTTWPGAATTIQAAVDASDDGDEIVVSNGIYRAASGDQVVSLTKSLTIRSEYGRDVTIIDGNDTRRGMYINPTGSEVPVRISGFSITNCSTGSGHGGAGFYLFPKGEIRIEDCVISNCTATAGSGGAVRKRTSTGTLILTNCYIAHNISSDGGGGVHTTDGGRLEMFNCQVLNNQAGPQGGGVFAQAPILMEDCQLSSNQATSAGGGFANWASETVINRCVFKGNHASAGGGIYVRHTALNTFISNCVVRGNTSAYTAGRVGAGIRFDGGGRLTGCLIEGNQASGSYGGGISLGTNAVVCENLTITANSAPSGQDGGGLYAQAESAATVLNSIIYGNTGGNLKISGDGITFNNCCTVPLRSGDGNIDDNPLFVDTENDQFQLKSLSPCINNGANQPWMDDALDLDGHRRLDRFTRQVDMGCYEYVHQGSLFFLK